MTFTACSRNLAALSGNAIASRGRRRGILRRVADAVCERRRKRLERDIAYFIELRGGRITDEVERQITQRLLGGGWRQRDRRYDV